jgi:flagellar basal body L-ring protein FlgH
MANENKMGSETIGAAGPKSKMTLFKDDRAEDIGAIIVTVIIVAVIVLLTMK